MPNEDGSKSGGRKAGTPNRLTSQVKEAIIAAFHAVGGAAYLERVAHTDHKTFCALVGKIVPGELKIDPESQLNLVVLRDYTGEHDGGKT